MEKQSALQLAQQLLDLEFESVNHNPTDYCKAMGWEENSPSTNLAKKKKGEINFTADDVNKLTNIICSLDTESTIEAAENDDVCDFLANCVAGHIINFKK